MQNVMRITTCNSTKYVTMKQKTKWQASGNQTFNNESKRRAEFDLNPITKPRKISQTTTDTKVPQHHTQMSNSSVQTKIVASKRKRNNCCTYNCRLLLWRRISHNMPHRNPSAAKERKNTSLFSFQWSWMASVLVQVLQKLELHRSHSAVAMNRLEMTYGNYECKILNQCCDISTCRTENVTALCCKYSRLEYTVHLLVWFLRSNTVVGNPPHLLQKALVLDRLAGCLKLNRSLCNLQRNLKHKEFYIHTWLDNSKWGKTSSRNDRFGKPVVHASDTSPVLLFLPGSQSLFRWISVRTEDKKPTFVTSALCNILITAYF